MRAAAVLEVLEPSALLPAYVTARVSIMFLLLKSPERIPVPFIALGK